MPMSAVIGNTEKTQNLWLAKLITAALFLVVCLSWGTTWLGIKVAVESLPPLTSAGLRFLIAFPLFLIFALVRQDPIFFPRKQTGFFVFVTLTYFSIPYYLLNYGEQHVSSGLTALLFSSMPVFILIFSSMFLKERIYTSQMVGIAIGFASLFMIIKTQGLHLGHTGIFGVAAILAAAIMHGFCYVITKQRGSAISVLTYNTLPIGVAGFLLFVSGLWLESPDLGAVTLRSWTALAYLGVIASVGGFIAYFILLKRLSPVILSFVFIIFPVFAVIFGSWYEGQPISSDLATYSAILLAGFAITKLPVEKLLSKNAKEHLG